MSTANYNPQAEVPDLGTLLEILKKDIFLNLNCHALAKVVSFNSQNNTIAAQVFYCRQFLQRDAKGNYYPQNVQYPQLPKVPVIVLGGISSSLTFPISPGDNCLLLFNDRDIQNWVTANAATGKPVATDRAHSLSDALAIVGLPTLSSYDTTHALLKNGTGAVGIGPTNKVLITASYNGTSNTPTLLTLLNQLITNVSSLVTATAAITTVGSATTQTVNPASQAAINAVSTSLTSTMTALAGLLE